MTHTKDNELAPVKSAPSANKHPITRIRELAVQLTRRVKHLKDLQEKIAPLATEAPTRDDIVQSTVTSKPIPGPERRRNVVLDLRKLSRAKAAFLLKRTRRAQIERLEQASAVVEQRIQEDAIAARSKQATESSDAAPATPAADNN